MFLPLNPGFQQLGLHHVSVAAKVVDVVVVDAAFLVRHAQILQTLAGLNQTGHRRVRADVLVLQVLHPFLQRTHGHLVELVHADDEILREHILWSHHAQVVTLVGRQPQSVLCVYADKRGLTVVQVVGTLAKTEVQDINAVHFLHLEIVLAASHVLGDGLRHTVEHALEVVQLAALLYLHQDDFSFGVPGLDVNTVKLVLTVLLVRLALQQFHDGHLLAHQYRDETLEDGKVGLVAKHILRCPVKAYISVPFHDYIFL